MRTHGAICIRMQILLICKLCTRMQIAPCVQAFRLDFHLTRHIVSLYTTQQSFASPYFCHILKQRFFHTIRRLFFNFDTVVEGWTQVSHITIHFCGNIILKSVKMLFSGKTDILGFEKAHLCFYGVQNAFWFSNWYS